MWPNPQETADLVTFTEEILNGKLHFLSHVRPQKSFQKTLKLLSLLCWWIIIDISHFDLQNVFSTGILRKMCSENMQQIYRRIPIAKCDFNKVAKITLWHGCSPVNLMHNFRIPFYEKNYGGMLLDKYIWFLSFTSILYIYWHHVDRQETKFWI